jgi:hypothetical protein
MMDGKRNVRIPRKREEQRTGSKSLGVDYRSLPGRPGVQLDNSQPATSTGDRLKLIALIKR